MIPAPAEGKTWQRFREHALEGYNTGHPPYGYAARRIPHPAPAKAAEGRAKTRLVPDPDRAPVVARIFQWRVIDRLGMNTIANRLNADPALPPPPGKAGCWLVSTVAAILANPKYTGYMVYGRTRTTGGKRGRKAPPDQWLWSSRPAHTAIITRAMRDAAQTIGQEHGNSRDPGDPLPDHAADAARQRDAETARLRQRIRHIDAAENAHAREIEHLAAIPAGSPAITALRTRILDRFTELETNAPRSAPGCSSSTPKHRPPPTPPSWTRSPTSPASSTTPPPASSKTSTAHSRSRSSTTPTETRSPATPPSPPPSPPTANHPNPPPLSRPAPAPLPSRHVQNMHLGRRQRAGVSGPAGSLGGRRLRRLGGRCLRRPARHRTHRRVARRAGGRSDAAAPAADRHPRPGTCPPSSSA